MFTSGSTVIESLEKRRYARRSLGGRVRLIAGKGLNRKYHVGIVKDVSETGIGLELSKVPPISTAEPVRIEWNVPAEFGGDAALYTLKGELVRISRPSTDATVKCGIRFEGLIAEQVAETKKQPRRVGIAIILLLLAALIVFLKSRNVISFWYQPVFQAYSLMAAFYVLSRVALAFVYKEPKDNGLMPAITVIIAAKNEEARIGECIDNCFSARYPSDLIEVIAVDDGSTDKTWDVLERAKLKHPNLQCIRFEKNRGKRHAMAIGTQKAKGKILIFIDSDSNVEPEGFYRIVQPFADKRVGAVAGHTLVIVEPDNLISKMEAVRYYVSQRIMKAAESVFNTVTCCPGPFSAYRRDAVMRVLPEWQNQRFFGTEATFGDDRSLTNFILRRYRVVYHAGARCATWVPEKWSVFFRQQLRWKKSWFRETTVAVRFMWKKHPATALAYYGSVLITLFSPVIGVRALLYLPLAFGSLSFLPYLGGLLLVYAFFGLVYQYFTLAGAWYYGIYFAFMYVFALSFQNYYALLTVHRNHWGTR